MTSAGAFSLKPCYASEVFMREQFGFCISVCKVKSMSMTKSCLESVSAMPGFCVAAPIKTLHTNFPARIQYLEEEMHSAVAVVQLKRGSTLLDQYLTMKSFA